MAKGSARRSRVVKAMVAFVAVLALLTFFSNTLMNLTIPKVMGAYASRGNLSYSNSARGTITVENQTEVKGLEGRTVDQIKVTNYDTVQAGDTILTLKPIEESEDLQSKRDRLKQLEREAEYDSRTDNTTDFTSYYDSINMAKATLSDAEDTLYAVQNKDAVEEENKQIINEESVKEVSLKATVTEAAKTVEDIQKQIDAIDASIAPLQAQIDVYTALGTPTPTPRPDDPETTEPAATEPETPVPEGATATPTPSPSPAPAYDEDGLDPTSPTYEMEKLMLKIRQYEDQKTALESQLEAAQTRLDEASAELAECQGKIKDAQAEIDALKQLPSEAAAQNAVTTARNAVNTAQKALSDAQTAAGITEDKARDTAEDREEEIAKLKKQIEELEKQAKVTEIKAPVGGYIYNIAVASGDALTAKTFVTYIIPETDRVCSVSFKFSSQAAQSIRVGMDLEITSGFIQGCTVQSIKPDPDNPRANKIVKCMVAGNDAWPGEEITVNAGRGNDNYKCVVPSSAVSEDNNGHFIYVIVGSSTPLGDKYTVKRVDVSIEATDGAATAIKGEGLDKYDVMIVVRAEKPLEDGQRVRLEDYTSK
ncbi:MAG: HlyD family efflux transporter periplasmic adaptor subunit [Ruminococcaceae bacterium]|nr:HlyD family efflux transporter periplasmic adaptor subunit [Oscillospiraceae bacterium]